MKIHISKRVKIILKRLKKNPLHILVIVDEIWFNKSICRPTSLYDKQRKDQNDKSFLQEI